MTEPRRVLIDWDYEACGIWLVLSAEELAAPAPPGHWSGEPPPGWRDRPRPWSNRLSSGLLDDLREWNDACCAEGADHRALQERGRQLADRVQGELGADGWEVLYRMDGRMHRVHPPGSWPGESWRQELLGYAPRGRQHLSSP